MTVTKQDILALRKCPPGWFTRADTAVSWYRINRLLRHGLLERRTAQHRRPGSDRTEYRRLQPEIEAETMR